MQSSFGSLLVRQRRISLLYDFGVWIEIGASACGLPRNDGISIDSLMRLSASFRFVDKLRMAEKPDTRWSLSP